MAHRVRRAPRIRWQDILDPPSTDKTTAWVDITGKPSTFAPSAHAHPTSDVTGLDTALAGKASTAHTHGVGDLSATGTRDATTFLRGDNTWGTPSGGGSASAATATTLGTVKISGTPTDAANPVAYVKEQTDTLLSGKAATAHTHLWADLTDKPTTFAPIIGSTATTAVAGNDARLTDARTPTAHTHAPSEITGTAVITTDSRLSDARTPLAHTHPASELSATGTRDATTFLRGDNTWAAPAGGGGATGQGGAHVDFYAGAALVSTNMPAADREFPLGTYITYRRYVDLTDAAEGRLIIIQNAAASATTATIRLQYSTDDGGTWADLGPSRALTNVTVANGTMLKGAWTLIATGGKADVLIRLVMAGGNGAADPSFLAVHAEFRG